MASPSPPPLSRELERGVRRRAVVVSALSAAVATGSGATKPSERLPVIGPAPAFALTSASNEKVSLAQLRSKVLAVTFVFTTCTSTCPILTAKLAEISRRLGPDFGPRINFVAITVDPLNDTPSKLRDYASAHGADMPGWHFLTGTPVEVSDVLHRYGVYAKKGERGEVDHLFLTSLIDKAGRLRVQYLGTRFDAREMQGDLQMLLAE